jgi:ABC-type nitrate/sulfonate/bicarbonate transport system permease component
LPVVAAITMIPLGFLMGWYRGFEEIADGLVQTLRQTSSLSLFPIFILFLGIGEESYLVYFNRSQEIRTCLRIFSIVQSIVDKYICIDKNTFFRIKFTEEHLCPY